MVSTVFSLLLVAVLSGATPLGPCYYDGSTYEAGSVITIPNCLATMRCLGNNNYGELTQLGGICPDKRNVDGQSGCNVDGKVYAKGQQIMTEPCLAVMTCEGNNVLSDPIQLGGVCPDKRDVDGQTGCNVDGKVYAKGQQIMTEPCLAVMTCEGDNVLSDPIQLSGVCPQKRQEDGQSGCLFDGTVYQTGDTIYIGNCLAKFTCLGHNSYSSITELGGQC